MLPIEEKQGSDAGSLRGIKERRVILRHPIRGIRLFHKAEEGDTIDEQTV